MNTKKPQVSIISSTYNNANVLRKVLKAMLELEYGNKYEIIVVNNGSKDNTKQILEEFSNEKNIKIINI